MLHFVNEDLRKRSGESDVYTWNLSGKIDANSLCTPPLSNIKSYWQIIGTNYFMPWILESSTDLDEPTFLEGAY